MVESVAVKLDPANKVAKLLNVVNWCVDPSESNVNNLSPFTGVTSLYSLIERLIVFPDLSNPVPAVIWPAPENWENVNEVVPTVMLPSVVRTNPESAFVSPSSIKVKAPLVTSVLLSKSFDLLQSPLLL